MAIRKLQEDEDGETARDSDKTARRDTQTLRLRSGQALGIAPYNTERTRLDT